MLFFARKYLNIALLLFFVILTNQYAKELAKNNEKDLENVLQVKSVFTAGGKISGYVMVDPRGGFFAFSEDKYIYRFSSTGEFITKIKFSGDFLPYHANSRSGMVYKLFADNTLKAINIKGETVWSVFNSEGDSSRPVINSQGNILVSSGKKIISYSPAGRLRWEFLTENFDTGKNIVFTAPLTAGRNGLVYAALSDGSIAAFNNYGDIIATFKDMNSKHLKPQINAVAAFKDMVVVADNDKKIFLLDQKLKIISTAVLKTDATAIASGGRNNSLIAVIEKSTAVQLFDENLKSFPVKVPGTGFTGIPFFYNDILYLVKKGGLIVRFDTKTMEIKEAQIPPEAVFGMRDDKSKYFQTISISAGSNMVVAGGLDWNFYFFPEPEIYVNNLLKLYDNDLDGYAVVPKNKQLIYINELSKRDDWQSKEKAISLLENLLSKGISGKDEIYAISIIERLSFVRSKDYTKSNSIIRGKSAQLLGKVGTGQAISILQEMLKIEPDYIAASDIIKQLGKIGSDYNGETAILFDAAYQRFPDNDDIFVSIVDAIRDIVVYNGYYYAESKQLLFKMLVRNNKNDLNLKINEILSYLE